MNKSFKVVFNKARGALMVVNEVTSSVQAKGTKTVIAAAVATLLAGGVGAKTLPNEITNSNIIGLGDLGTAIIEADGQELNIQTNGSMQTFLGQLEKVKEADTTLGKLFALLAMTEVPKDKSHASVFLATGGSNKLDINAILSPTEPGTGSIDINKTGNTTIQIGSVNKTSNPLVVGIISGDLFLSNDHGSTINRTGTSSMTISSGNVAGVIGGSAGILIGNPNQAKADSVKVSKTTIDATSLTLNGSANVGGFFGGSVAIGTNHSNVEGIVKNGTNIVIDMNDDAKPGNLDGLVIGGFGGGLALGLGQSVASVNNGEKTQIEVINGEVLGLIGGGAAVSWDIGSEKLGTLIGEGSATSKTTSNAINFEIGEKATTIGTIGAGVAASDAFSSHVGYSEAIAESVKMTFNGTKTGLTEDQKQQLHGAIQQLPDFIKNKDLSKVSSIAGALDIDGVHLGNLGGGLAFARSQYEVADGVIKGSSTAISKVGEVVMTFNGGYNVATAAGGLAITHDLYGFAEEEQGISKATAEVGSTTININGGENILVTAGGMAAGFASSGLNSATLAESKVNGKATVNVNNGSVDGLFGGGIALDDTAASKTNATTYVNDVVLNVQGGTVNVANIDPIKGIVGSINDKIGVPEYVLETAEIVGKNHGKVAILGGGMATGAGANATADAVNINLTGGKVVGNALTFHSGCTRILFVPS